MGRLCGRVVIVVLTLAASVGVLGASAASADDVTACFPQVVTDASGTTATLSVSANTVEAAVLAGLGWLAPGQARTVTHVLPGGVVTKLTVSKASDGSVSVEFDVAAAATPTTFVKVWSGQGTKTVTVGGPTETDTSGMFDFSALRSVIVSSPAAGQLTFTEQLIQDPSKPAPGIKQTLMVTFTSFVPQPSDPLGPRSGAFTSVAEPNGGGLLQFNDSLVLGCGAISPSPASTNVVRRFFSDPDHTIHARTDSRLTGGPIPLGDQLIGLACSTTPPPLSGLPASEYGLTKLEDASGNTVEGTTSGDATACSPDFGAIPALTNNATDYNFATPPTFPGEW
jgi:hypothetical protein